MYAQLAFIIITILIIAVSGMGINYEVVEIEVDEFIHLKDHPSSDVTFYVEDPFKIEEGKHVLIRWSSSIKGVERVKVSVRDEFISTVTEHEEIIHEIHSNLTVYSHINFHSNDPVTVDGIINMTAKFIGFNEINVLLLDSTEKTLGSNSLPVGVTLKIKDKVKIIQICLTTILISVYLNMGLNMNLGFLKNILEKPITPVIGLFSQYTCMPLISFVLGLILFPDEPHFRLGLLASGSAPGGGFSNMWTNLLGGSVDLSIFLTIGSSVAALGAAPFWYLILGNVILKDTSHGLPFQYVLIEMAMLILPCFAGLFIQLTFPKLARIIKFVLSPLTGINVLFLYTFGIYVNTYLFSFLTWKVLIAAFGQTILGLIMGYITAFILRRPAKERIAISVETAIQKNGIAFLLTKVSLGKPAGDMAVVLPASIGLLTPVPMFVLVLIKLLYLKVKRLLHAEEESVKEAADEIEKEKEKNKTNNISIIYKSDDNANNYPTIESTYL